MESSEQQTKIINLGKQLVQDLDLDNRVDTLSRWMAHYVAEKITLTEHMPPGADKNAIEKECFETTLQLWENRWYLPSGKRPLEDFEPILRVLKRLDPDNPEPFLDRYFDRDLIEAENKNSNANEIANNMATAIKIDKVARVWIEFVLQQAAQSANSEKVQNLFDNTFDIDDSDDMLTISGLLGKDSTGKDGAEAIKKQKIEKLQKRIDELEKFAGLNTFILEKYKKELEPLL
jgi:hypothetical protein